MSEWWTYSPSNFLMFSARVYYRLFELYNQQIWPAQILAIALGLTALYLLVRDGRATHRSIFALLGGLWIVVGWAFIWKHFATINWPMAYVAPVFAAEGLLLIGVGAAGGGLTFPPRRSAGSPTPRASLCSPRRSCSIRLSHRCSAGRCRRRKCSGWHPTRRCWQRWRCSPSREDRHAGR